MEYEDVHIVYCVAKQIQFEVTAEQGAKLNPTDDVTIYYSIEPQTSKISRFTYKQRLAKKLSMKDGEINIVITQNT
ncbi:unnamed protein product [Rotaria sordida]|nr:unnamed protein product [Rotaria sordida]